MYLSALGRRLHLGLAYCEAAKRYFVVGPETPKVVGMVDDVSGYMKVDQQVVIGIRHHEPTSTVIRSAWRKGKGALDLPSAPQP